MTPHENGSGADCYPSDITSREKVVCEAICSSAGEVGFSDLKRKTEFHQEILSRVLYRLQYRGLICKSDKKYIRCVCQC